MARLQFQLKKSTFTFLFYIFSTTYSKCDPENCPDMGIGFSCGKIISEGRDNIKCGYMTKSIDKYAEQETKCKSKCPSFLL